MANYFLSGGKRFASAFSALAASLLLMTSCGTETADLKNNNVDNKDAVLPISQGPVPEIAPIGVDVPVAPVIAAWDTIELMVRTDPADPHNERFLNEWRVQAFTIDDEGRPTSPLYFGETGPDGNALLGLPGYMFTLPLVISAYNEVLADCLPDPQVAGAEGPGLTQEEDLECTCRQLEIFVPAFCHDKAVWLLGPVEDAVWDFYRRAAERQAEAWNPSQVDCPTWLAHLQLLILTDRIADELHELSDRDDMIFREEALDLAFQENQHLLTPTRPPICMAERRHNGGRMVAGEVIDIADFDPDGFIIDDSVEPFVTEVLPDSDPIAIADSGLVQDICGIPLDAALNINTMVFNPPDNQHFLLDDRDFMGTVHIHPEIIEKMDVRVINTRLGNGRPLDHDKYDDACALTSVIEVTNKDDDERDVELGSGVTFTDLFGATDTVVHLTSDGDTVVDDSDTWAIFFNSGAVSMRERVLAVELLGHRAEDFRDVLHMTFDDTENLFLGLRADYELNEEEVDGERAFLHYTITVWDGQSENGRKAIRNNIENCYEASDVWARQFFVTSDFFVREDECCYDEECEIESLIKPLVAAEFAVRSQCFSNSRANQRWRTDDSGYWSMNTEHGVHGNVIVNPGWLAPNLNFEIYVQKFDEAVFKGPRTIRRTDDCGQLLAEIPTLVEGDRVLLKAEDSCCDDYDLVIPCVPEFTGFAGAPGIPYVPVTLGPPPVPPIPVGPVGPGPVPPGPDPVPVP